MVETLMAQQLGNFILSIFINFNFYRQFSISLKTDFSYLSTTRPPNLKLKYTLISNDIHSIWWRIRAQRTHITTSLLLPAPVTAMYIMMGPFHSHSKINPGKMDNKNVYKVISTLVNNLIFWYLASWVFLDVHPPPSLTH